MAQKKHAVQSCNPDWLEQPDARPGCKDIWNSWMLDDKIEWDLDDIPFCPTTAEGAPRGLVFYKDAIDAHRENMRKLGPNYQIDSFLHGWDDDYKYDSRKNSIWLFPEQFWTVAKHYAGFITPDFSTNIDFPDPIRRYNTYRMRTMGCWMVSKGKSVINNVRWGLADNYDIEFAGLPENSILAIGSVASSLKKLADRPLFEKGLRVLAKRLSPRILVVYGSANYPIFEELRNLGIEIVAFPSKTSLAFKERGSHEQVA